MNLSFLRCILVGATLLCMAAILTATFSPAKTVHAATVTINSAASCDVRGWNYYRGYTLYPGDSSDVVTTCSGNALKLIYQTNGNLVLYCNSNTIWSTGTTIPPGSLNYADYTSFQDDGNFVVYTYFHNYGPKAVWASNTNGKGANWLSLQRDGNLVIYQYVDGAGYGHNHVWASGTNGRC